MKIYTKTGDDGSTGLYGGSRVWRGNARVDALGDVDELNAVVGLARSASPSADLDRVLGQIQNWLFDVGSEIGTATESKHYPHGLSLGSIEALEVEIDHLTERLTPLKNFILPAGTDLATRLHVARAVCRRAERSVAKLTRQEPLRQEILVFFNRLSDWLFVAARTANVDQGVSDIAWQKPEDR